MWSSIILFHLGYSVTLHACKSCSTFRSSHVSASSTLSERSLLREYGEAAATFLKTKRLKAEQRAAEQSNEMVPHNFSVITLACPTQSVVHIHCPSPYCLFTCYKPWKGAEQWRWGAWGGGASKPLCFGLHAGAQLRSLVVGGIPYSHWKNDFALGRLNQIFYHNNPLLFLNNKQLLLHIMTWVSWVWNEIPSRIVKPFQTNTQFV